MEMFNKFQEVYGPGEDERFVDLRTREILDNSLNKYKNRKYLEKALSCIDLTSLNPEDNSALARRFCGSVNNFSAQFPGLPNVAALCVYPTILEDVKKNLSAPGVKLAVVGAGFPSSQTFLSVKLAECKLLASKGADKIDIVISLGRFLGGDFQYVADEIALIKEAISGVHLKVILETGKLVSSENIRTASLLAMESGADFIKTSTGKESPAASPEAVYVMARAIRDFYAASGKMVGIKPAGGIVSPDDALTYLTLVMEILGDDWCNPGMFRIGASRLANNLLSEILQKKLRHF